MNILRRFLSMTAPSALAAAFVVTSLTPVSPAAAAPGPVDGKTQQTAAASCFEIKQRDRTSQSGVYWLLTPAMDTPQEFYCDQTTDGGGWVMVGRGREGWTESYEGQGNPASLRNTITGPEAFKPAQLSSETVDELLNGQRPDELSEGLRIRRAKDQAGRNWQEVRLGTTNQPRWSWTLSASIPVPNAYFDGERVTNQLTSWAQIPRHWLRGYDPLKALRFTDRAEQGYLRGFAFDDGVRGTTDANSHLWARDSSTGAIPFAQMYIRPQVTQDAFSGREIPAAGTAVQERRELPNSGAEPTRWGAVGRADGGQGELNTEVQAFAESAGSVFAGGNFARMQRDANGAEAVDQKYLAAFDLNTGELRTDFRPVLNGQVKALQALPGDRVAVGGQFSTVNGVSSPGLAVLNARTGELDPAWKLKIENLVSGGVIQVRGLSLRDNDLYLAGSFTHLTGGTDPYQVYARGAAKINATNGTPDRAWNPNFNGTATDVDASDRGDRVYASGYFSQSGPNPAFRLAAMSAQGAATLTPWSWTPSMPPRAGRVDGFQFAVKEHGDTVWAGGAEHSMFGYNRDTLSRTQENITMAGGDFQSISNNDDTVFGSCHCGHFNYSEANKYAVPRGAFSVADRIDLIGAWDSASGSYLPEFNPRLKGHGGWGIWGSMVDSRGVLWAGGDIARSDTQTGWSQWSGGFVRFAPRDASAPGTPTDFRVTPETVNGAATHKLSWKGSGGSGTVYQLLSGDRTVATTAETSYSLPATEGATYAVRAADSSGNISASTPLTAVGAEPTPEPAPEPTPTDEPTPTPTPEPSDTTPGTAPYSVLDAKQQWRYRFDAAAPDSNWRSVDFDDSSWSEGAAPLGRGTADLGTQLTAPEGTTPRSFQVRREVNIDQAADVEKLTLTTRADDGIVVYVNGVEVTRSQLPDGPINHNTFASAAPRTAAAVQNPVTVEVPGWMLKDGRNVVSAQVHANWGASPDLSFELTAQATPGEAPEPPTESSGNQPLVAAGSKWSVRHVNSAPSDNWFQGPVDPEWSVLTAPVGWGQGVSSVLKADSTRPISTQLIREFDVTNPDELHELLLTTRSDDGVIVWINGQEVARAGLPTGAVNWSTYSTQAPRTAAATENPMSVVVPASALKAGKNTVAVQMHVNYRSTPDASADVTLQAVPEEAAEARMAEAVEEENQ